MSTVDRFSVKYGFLFLTVLWLLIQLVLYINYGFVTGFEGEKYILTAKEFIAGEPINQKLIFYYAYPLVIALFIKMGVGIQLMLVIQLLIGAWATYRFYCISKILFPNNWTSIVTTAILILTIQLQQWNYFLFTESLFTSGIIIYSYRLLTVNYSRIFDFVILGVLFFVLSFIRPNGILLLIPTLVYISFNLRQKENRVIILPLIISMGLIIWLNLTLSTGNFHDFFWISFSNKWIIWGYNSFDPTNRCNNSIIEIIQLFFYRILYYFSMQRPHYSQVHNLLMMTFYPVYILAVLGAVSFLNKYKAVFIYSSIIVLSFFVLTIVLFVNWHGRFIVPILPFFILSAGFGIQLLANKWRLRKA